MLTSEDVRRVTFDKAMRGYRCEDVNDYLKQVADSMDALRAQNDDLQKKLTVLGQRIEQYRAEEDTLHTTLINAQRLGENVIKEAKQKAAEVLRAANIKAEDREQRARDEVELSKQELTTLKKESNDFRKTLMTLYRKHIELITTMPEYSTGESADAESTPQSVQEEEAYDPAPAPQVAPEPPVQPAYQPVQAAYQPAYDEPDEEPAPVVPTVPPEASGEGKVDTVEFAIAPRQGEESDPADSAASAEPAVSEADEFKGPFAPGAGLYDVPETPKPRGRAPGRKPGSRRKKATGGEDAAVPDSFDSFSNIDFDS